MSSCGDDDTIRVTSAPTLPRRRPAWIKPAAIGGGLLLLSAAAVGLLVTLRPATGPIATQPVSLAGSYPLASEAQILTSRVTELTIRRLAENPAILVLDFPGLTEQARMLNRVAALVEKVGQPRDRVLDDAALAVAVRADGGTEESFYYGHNYRAADLARFFALADRDGVRLTPQEERLRSIARDLGWLRDGAAGALVSVPQAGAEPWLDMRARATMLRHELSHGEFFTNAAYAANVWRFWNDALDNDERAQLRAVLSQASYDPSVEEVMANEAQAFLFHTPDERFFSPASLGFTTERMAALRAGFVADMPPGWLRDALAR
jgi:hypothetical protein